MFKERIKWPEGEWTHFRSSADFVVAFWRIFDTDPIAVVTAAAGHYRCRGRDEKHLRDEIKFVYLISLSKNSIFFSSKIYYYADSDIEENDLDFDRDAPRHQQLQPPTTSTTRPPPTTSTTRTTRPRHQQLQQQERYKMPVRRAKALNKVIFYYLLSFPRKERQGHPQTL